MCRHRKSGCAESTARGPAGRRSWHSPPGRRNQTARSSLRGAYDINSADLRTLVTLGGVGWRWVRLRLVGRACVRLFASSVLLAPIVAATLVAQGPSAADPGARLHMLFDREWDWELQQSPLTASSLSDKRWNDRWDDMSLAALDM